MTKAGALRPPPLGARADGSRAGAHPRGHNNDGAGSAPPPGAAPELWPMVPSRQP
jgi:hypothetical protein